MYIRSKTKQFDTVVNAVSNVRALDIVHSKSRLFQILVISRIVDTLRLHDFLMKRDILIEVPLVETSETVHIDAKNHFLAFVGNEAVTAVVGKLTSRKETFGHCRIRRLLVVMASIELDVTEERLRLRRKTDGDLVILAVVPRDEPIEDGLVVELRNRDVTGQVLKRVYV